MKLFLIALLCKALSLAGRVLGGGTDLPGRIALRLCPHVMARIRFSGKIIAVTGSNGKTTTANIIAHVLRENGYTVVNNASGSNLTSGVATTLLCACSPLGRIRADYVVLEVDECYARFIFEDIPVNYFLVLNLLRDQVVRNGHPDLVFEKIVEAISKRPGMQLLLNANDPLSQNLSVAGSAVYFAMDRTARSTDVCVSGTHDCKICPRCFHKMEYSYFHYNHLGRFRCTSCGYASHTPDFLGTAVSFEDRTLQINGVPVQVAYDTTFNIFNTIAASAACCTAGLTLEQFARHVGSFSVAKTRLDDFLFDGRRAVLMMTKQNAASLDQSISYVLEQGGGQTVALYINNVLYSGFKDISWLYDVAFSRLKGQVAHILCVGNRALDAAVCMKAAGFDDSEIIYENDAAKTKEAFRKTSGDIYILAASAFGHEGNILEELKA